jgi:hypothetical protein
VAISFADRQAEIASAMRHTKDLHETWRDLEQLYRNGTTREYIDTAALHRDIVTVNYAYANVRVLLALMMPPQMRIFVKPLQEHSGERAQVIEKIAKYAWSNYGVERECRRALLDALVFSDGFIKLGFGREFAPDEDLEGDEIEKRMREILSQQPQFPDEEPFFEAGGQSIEFDPDVLSNVPWAKRCSPYDLFPDPTTDEILSGRYLIHRITRALDDAKKEPTYDHRDEIIATGRLDVDEDGKRWQLYRRNPGRGRVIKGPGNDPAMQTPQHAEVVDIYEFYDRRTSKLYTMCDSSNHYLRVIDMPFPELKGFPFRHLQINSSPGEPWGIGEIQPIAYQQMELNRIREFGLLHWKRSCKGNILASKGAAAKEEMSQLCSADIVKVTEVQDINEFRVLDMPQLPPELYAIEDRVIRDIQNVSAISESDRGRVTGGTATETTQVAQRGDLIDEIRRKQVRVFDSGVLKDFFEIWRDRITQGQIMRIAGPDAYATLLAQQDHEARGEYDFDIRVEESVEQDVVIRRKQMTELLNISMPLVQFIPELMQGIRYLYREVLDTFDVPNREKICPESPPMMPGMMQQNPMFGGAGGAPPQPPMSQTGGMVPPGGVGGPFPTAGQELAGAKGASTRKRGLF